MLKSHHAVPGKLQKSKKLPGKPPIRIPAKATNPLVQPHSDGCVGQHGDRTLRLDAAVRKAPFASAEITAVKAGSVRKTFGASIRNGNEIN